MINKYMLDEYEKHIQKQWIVKETVKDFLRF